MHLKDLSGLLSLKTTAEAMKLLEPFEQGAVPEKRVVADILHNPGPQSI